VVALSCQYWGPYCMTLRAVFDKHCFFDPVVEWSVRCSEDYMDVGIAVDLSYSNALL